MLRSSSHILILTGHELQHVGDLFGFQNETKLCAIKAIEADIHEKVQREMFLKRKTEHFNSLNSFA